MQALIEAIAAVLLLSGAFFSFVAAMGVLRLQDVLIRMHASTKAGTLGCGLILLSVAVFYREADVVTQALAAIGFLLVTTPIAAHIIGRAAYARNTPLWEGTVVDELRGRYDFRRRRLDGDPALPQVLAPGEAAGPSAGSGSARAD